MKIIIFSLSKQAIELQRELREDGQRAVLRNPEFFNSHPSQIEKCDKVFCESKEIQKTYEAKEIEVELLKSSNKVTSVAPSTRTEAACEAKKGDGEDCNNKATHGKACHIKGHQKQVNGD